MLKTLAFIDHKFCLLHPAYDKQVFATNAQFTLPAHHAALIYAIVDIEV